MPAINDPQDEISHLRKLYLQQQGEIAAITDKLCSARQEMDDSRREARNLRAENARFQAEAKDERDARRTAERSLRIANDALVARRKAQDVGAEMLAAIQTNNRNGRNTQ